MKKNLLIGTLLVVLAGLGIGVIAVLPPLQDDNKKPVTIKPKTIAELPRKEEPKKPVEPAKKKVVQVAQNEIKPPKKDVPIVNGNSTTNEKKIDAEPKQNEEKKTPAKIEPEPKKVDVTPEPKKIEVKIETKVEVKVDPKKTPVTKIIVLGDDLIKLNDPDGEYTVKSLHGARKLELIGRIKTLKIADINERSTLDLKGLIAEEVIFLGNINSGSKVILGQTKSLKIRDLNDHSLLDASAAEASVILFTGAINSGSTVKLHAPKGSVEFLGAIPHGAQIEIMAPEGKVVFKSRGDSVINGDAKLTIVAKELEFTGAINGAQTQLDVTLTKGGELKFRRLNGGVRLTYRKADASDPDLRVEPGQLDANAVLREMPALKK